MTTSATKATDDTRTYGELAYLNTRIICLWNGCIVSRNGCIVISRGG